MAELETIIGLEVHAQMSTDTKMFCGCDNDAFGKAPNTTICPICMGHPGTLPVPNASAVTKAILTSLALKGTVNEENHFDRKHYFYPDLPMGFQISQYDFPLSSGGSVSYVISDDSGKKLRDGTCGITRLHMENDAGKLTHRGATTLCDYNRAGTPLMEIVTEPDLRSADEAVAFAQELRRILIAIGSSDADMFKGMMRFDASISLREKGTKKLNPRSEIKNLNSFKALEKALKYEEKRLRNEWKKSGGPLPNDITVGWQDDEEKTRMLRNKESADDYRYFPEPDIPPLKFTKKDIEELRKQLPPLPQERKAQYTDMGLDEAQAMQLIDQPDLQRIFDAVYEKTGDGKRTSGLVLTQLLGFLKTQEKSIEEGPNAAGMLELITKIDDGTISGNAAKDVMEKMIQTGKSATEIIAQEGMQQISDDGAIEALVRQAIDANPQAIESFRSGKEAALGAIVGWVMKESKGQANPETVQRILREKL
ncbi:Asp-tRNA(Asn)/Glu-tRNA(Gln) amidotransferase GatCAB subunit B [Candidatus Peregrinibacteria bacterium CG10_big_fil_rev_8_21_14_0_10_49_24]|nr:MAG: Asp-tRNA(Asn)/Glu-tRNA(Gln) amidotransferase GatCAB subunit B [Candidatus Peregrinibacteria bacterium CG11_big_fil_rev_8_21_14_0_20_49_14]PIR51631.1 MAG: Asp-tRNA(Asn)/Glu-tRNA(Gln) amidotransferase GatCAB subunit B [Candidatus Peregrinibacteria bacterium CG10_big_fil_rev_8_21_14_0_10_49_24]PJA68009.1 MAG: Asp-tRNA(Asn)/Glu-tRNA(Gln) amidotransferase GatCAB subunit B [Candidatus Peregrinibacteria bacterium CG_4_9_14_3_um_filter_49_12]